jgi:diguanylate cyclase
VVGIYNNFMVMLVYVTYMSNQIMVSIMLLGGFLLVVLCLALLISNNKKNIAEQAAEQEIVQLQENYAKLEVDFGDILEEKEELVAKNEALKQKEASISKIAYTDHLTDLPNRIAFMEKLDHITMTLRKGEIVAVMVFDLDNFKEINDTLGHSYGDELLIDVTDRIKQVVDENDYLARFGGDEFIILSQNISDIGEYDDKIKKVQNVFSYPFILGMKEFFVTISIGIGIVPTNGKTTQTILKSVDAAMYAVKEMGGNTYSYFSESINNKLLEKIQVQSELRSAIENEEFVAYFQPQMDFKKDSVVGFEALIRWNHPTKGMIFPKDFFSIAIDTGLIIPIGRWILTQACRQLKKWELEGFKSITMAVNLTTRQFKDKDLITMIEEVINETGINPGNLVLDIKESVVFDNMDYAIEIIKKVKRIGIKFSLDNFGDGYSSMAFLKSLPLDSIKIDRSFIYDLNDSKTNQRILTSIIALAQALELEVIAEGIEQEDQVKFLLDANCMKGQGFLFSEPLSIEEADYYLKDTRGIHE